MTFRGSKRDTSFKPKRDVRQRIRAIDFDNPTRPGFPIEVLSLTELIRKAPPEALTRPLRPSFHQVVFATRKRIRYELDFQRTLLTPGSVAWAYPGQVQRLDVPAGADGWLLMFPPDVLDRSVAEDLSQPLAPRITLGEVGREVRWLLERIRRHSLATCKTAHPIARHLLHALLLLLRSAGGSAAANGRSEGEVFSLFRREVDRRFSETRRLSDYARILGYSGKTLHRATQRATGLGAKQYIDQRVLLEARRLLAHSQLRVGAIATDLGFSELTNFVKFFRRESGGQLPLAFRAGWQR